VLELNEVYNIDCIDGMKLIDDNIIDLIITSPPYNLGNNHHTGNKNTNTYYDNMPEDEYQKWQIDVLNECYRILKNNGSLMYNHKNRIKKGKQISPYEWLFKTKFIIKQEIVWFNGSQNFDKIRFYPMTERIYWLAKSEKTKLYNTINHHDFFNKSEWKSVGTKNEFKRAYPEEMVKDLISVFPNANIILDPFVGSGTTLKMAKKLGRNYLGMDISQEYVDISKERIRRID
jgi:site-specific DNA-methyltransferase (adenine-specific)